MKKMIILGMLVTPLLGLCQCFFQQEKDFESFNHIIEEQFRGCVIPCTYETQGSIQAYTIPRGISPNGDGLNDVFDLTGFKVKKLSIYNHSGVELYSKTDYTNQWEGQDNNGNKLPMGTYFYRIEKSDGKRSTGWVYINREI